MKNGTVKSTTFPYKYAWTSPDLKTYNQTHHVFIHKRRRSNTPDVRYFTSWPWHWPLSGGCKI